MASWDDLTRGLVHPDGRHLAVTLRSAREPAPWAVEIAIRDSEGDVHQRVERRPRDEARRRAHELYTEALADGFVEAAEPARWRRRLDRWRERWGDTECSADVEGSYRKVAGAARAPSLVATIEDLDHERSDREQDAARAACRDDLELLGVALFAFRDAALALPISQLLAYSHHIHRPQLGAYAWLSACLLRPPPGDEPIAVCAGEVLGAMRLSDEEVDGVAAGLDADHASVRLGTCRALRFSLRGAGLALRHLVEYRPAIAADPFFCKTLVDACETATSPLSWEWLDWMRALPLPKYVADDVQRARARGTTV